MTFEVTSVFSFLVLLSFPLLYFQILSSALPFTVLPHSPLHKVSFRPNCMKVNSLNLPFLSVTAVEFAIKSANDIFFKGFL